jgi:hypothetical protein
MWKSPALRYATLALLTGIIACEDDTAEPSSTLTYQATLIGASEVQPVTTNATGTATVTIDAAKNLTYTATFTGLSSGLTGAHIHAPALPGTSAGIVVPFTVTTGGTSGTIGPTTVSLTSTLTGAINADSLISLINSGRAYVNIHSSNNPTGEIRGWLIKQ